MMWIKNNKFLLFWSVFFIYFSENAFSQNQNLLIRTSIAEIIGNKKLTSHTGKPLILFQTQNVDQKYKFFLQSGLHGNEKLPPEFMFWLMERYIKGESPLNSLSDSSIDFLVHANPDATELNTRNNIANVDLNRNFNILWGKTTENPGLSSFSEPETKSIKALFQKRKYLAAVDIHGYVNWIVTPTPARMLENRKTSLKYDEWIEILKSESKSLPNYELKSAGELGDGGAFEDWAFWEENVYTYCLELKSQNRVLEDHKKNNIDSFILYEKYIFNTFQQTIKLRGN